MPEKGWVNCILSYTVHGFCKYADEMGECPLELADVTVPDCNDNVPCGEYHRSLGHECY